MGNSNHKSKQSIKPGGKPTKLNTHIKGTIGEYQEIVNLTKAGWHISKSCDPQCPFDLVAVSHDGHLRERRCRAVLRQVRWGGERQDEPEQGASATQRPQSTQMS